MSTMRVATAEDHMGLVASHCNWQPGDVIQPMNDGERRTMRVLKRMEHLGGWPMYFAIDKHGIVWNVWVSDDPRRGNLADAEDEW